MMNYKNTIKMLNGYQQRIHSEIGEYDLTIDTALGMKSVENILDYLKSVDHTLASFIELHGLRELVQEHSKITVQVLKVVRDRNGNFKRHCKVITTWGNNELASITIETAYALGYQFCYLKGTSGYVDQFTLLYDGASSNPSQIVSELSQLLFNDPMKLESRSL